MKNIRYTEFFRNFDWFIYVGKSGIKMQKYMVERLRRWYGVEV